MAEIDKITLQQISSRIRQSFKLWDAEGYKKLSPKLLTHLINQAQIKIAKECKCIGILKTTDAVTANQRSHDLPDDFLELIELRIGTESSTGFRGHPVKIVKSETLADTTGWRR